MQFHPPARAIHLRGGARRPNLSHLMQKKTPSDSQTRMPMEGFDGAAASRRLARGSGAGAPR